jgi:hypothetical protein
VATVLEEWGWPVGIQNRALAKWRQPVASWRAFWRLLIGLHTKKEASCGQTGVQEHGMGKGTALSPTLPSACPQISCMLNSTQPQPTSLLHLVGFSRKLLFALLVRSLFMSKHGIVFLELQLRKIIIINSVFIKQQTSRKL